MSAEFNGNHSATLGALAEALAKAQGEMTHAKKSAENPFFKSHYADLPAVIDAARPYLAKNNLAVTQLPTGAADNMELITMLIHSSGEYVQSRYPIRPIKHDPQSIGSAITYARRYAFCAITGMAAMGEDDDGNAATIPQKNGNGHGKSLPASLEMGGVRKAVNDDVAQPPAPEDAPYFTAEGMRGVARQSQKPATEKQLKYLATLLTKAGIDGSKHRQALQALTGYDDESSLTVSQGIEKLKAGNIAALSSLRSGISTGEAVPDWDDAPPF